MKTHFLKKLFGERGPAVVVFLMIFVETAVGQIIPSHRRIDWVPGVPGGIPHRTTIYTTLQPGATAAQINSALAACPNNQVVMLAAGTYSISQPIVVPSYKTLRGAGPGRTILSLSGSSSGAIRFGSETGPSSGTSASLTGGMTKGSTNITLSSATGITPGTLLMINQLDESAFVTSMGSKGACDWCDAGWPGNRNMGQVVEVTSVSGNTVGIYPPLYWPYNNSPLANRFTPGCKFGGVEDLTVYANNTGHTANFLFSGSAYCWLRNVEGDFADGDHARVYWSLGCEIRDSYFHDGFSHTSGQTDDCVVLAHKSSACLVENNVFWRMHVSVMLEWGAAGNVISYNYSTNLYHQDYLAWMINDFVFHGAHPAFNLFEGNIGIQFRPDTTWGSSSHSTLLRNHFTGSDYYAPPLNARGTIQWSSGQWESANNYAYSIDYLSLSNNLVGNIAGSQWLVQNGATALRVAPDANGRACYRFGYNSDTDAGVGRAAYDSAVFHGNYDAVSRAQQWDSRIADRTIPTSYYRSSKPAWFGNLRWPPLDPANSATFSITNIPAGYRFLYKTNPPTGSTGNQTPVAVAAATPKAGAPPLAVNFSSAGSSDPEGAALSYSWAFGDGTTSTAANPSKTYSSAGTFTARLTVSDGVNSASSTNLPIVVSANQPPVISVNATPRSGAAPLTVNFSSTGSSDPEGSSLTYSWAFGDGVTTNAANPSKTYNTAGTFTARLTVSDGVNSVNSTNIVITVTNAGNQRPIAVASATPTSGAAPLAVNFSSAGTSDPEGSPLTYSWVFGDGGTSTAANPARTYSATGSYTARLTVSDGVNSTTSSNITISVFTAGSGLVAAYSFDGGSGSSALDASGNSLVGAITGATWSPTGKFGRALSFGANARVTVNATAALNLSNAMTLEAWVYPTSFSGTWMNVIIKPAGDLSLVPPSYVLQGTMASSQVPSMFVSPATNNLAGTSSLPLNTWSHLAATYDGAAMRLYVNGTQVASRAQTGAIAASTNALTIGGNAFNNSSWRGMIDEVRIYNRALSVSEIQSDMNKAVGGSTNKLAPPGNVRIIPN